MVYALYIRTKSKSGWTKYSREGATKKKRDAIKVAKKTKSHSNRPLAYRIKKISGTQGYLDLKTRESVLPRRKKHR